MTTQNNIKSLNLDKSKWKLTKLGELADEISVRVDNPSKSKYDRFVGLEHFVSGDIKIKNWGTTENLVSSTKAFQKGDILFARRNAYLRRASLVEFDGCCSGDAFVLRENYHKVVSGFLAFLMNSNALWDYANSNAAGTMSKRVKWRDLEEYEFLLPPKDQQAQLAELLWAMDEVIEKEKEIFKQVDNLFKVETKLISETKGKKDIRKLKDVCLIKDNLRKPINSSERDLIKGDVPYFGANGLVDYLNDYIFNEDLVLIAEDGGNFNEFYNREIAYRVSGKSWVNNHAHVLTVKEKSFPIDWLFYSLVHKNILMYITGTTRLKLNKSDLENITIWLPKIDEMNILINKLQKIDLNRKQINCKLQSSQSLQKSLINQVF